jgi:hypothetical protein
VLIVLGRYFLQKHNDNSFLITNRNKTMHVKYPTTAVNGANSLNLAPQKDSNPQSSSLQADAMTTVPRRTG